MHQPFTKNKIYLTSKQHRVTVTQVSSRVWASSSTGNKTDGQAPLTSSIISHKREGAKEKGGRTVSARMKQNESQHEQKKTHREEIKRLERESGREE
eukprot:5261754-Pleurochrysis_carterae.AAC.2